jgi:hypothetical protein
MKSISLILISVALIFSCNLAKNKNVTNKKSNYKVETIKNLVSEKNFTFENCELNKIPKGWSQYFIGRGETNWKVLDDNGNKVLAQLSDNNPNYHFNEVVFDSFIVKNVELQVQIKGVNGRKDQGGGFIWRFINANNYYVVRANPLEDNVVLYKVVAGERTDLPLIGKGKTYGVDVEPLGNNWNTLKLNVTNKIFTVYLNDKEIFKVKDSTFTKAGKIGLWTKADAVTYFDNLLVKPLK